MIFLTVGTQLPFDRLVNVVNEFSLRNPDIEIFGQVGKCQIKNLNFEHVEQCSISEFDRYFTESKVIVSHAGMGTILTSLTSGKPLFMMAREHRFGEHRNDHQLGTMARFSSHNSCYKIDSLNDFESSYSLLHKQEKGEIKNTLDKNAPKSTLDNLSAVLDTILEN